MTDMPDSLVAEPIRSSCSVHKLSQPSPHRPAPTRYDSSMFDGKLITLICALAILGFGACGGGYVRPTPRPVPPVLSRSHHITVQVEDTSGKDPVNADLMSRKIASSLNDLWTGRPLHFKDGAFSSRADAGLKITILRKTESCDPLNRQNRESCDFRITSSIVLVGSDGRVLWHFENYVTSARVSFKNGFPPDAWARRDTTDVAAYALASDVFNGLSHFIPSNSEAP